MKKTILRLFLTLIATHELIILSFASASATEHHILAYREPWSISSIDNKTIYWEYELNEKKENWAVYYFTPNGEVEMLAAGKDNTVSASDIRNLYFGDTESSADEIGMDLTVQNNILQTLQDYAPSEVIRNQEEQISCLRNAITQFHNIAFFTGAGMSCQIGIPTLLDLYKSLELTPIKFTHSVTSPTLKSLKDGILKPELQASKVSILLDFLIRLRSQSHQASEAYKSLAAIINSQILLNKKAYYYTSNLDNIGKSVGLNDNIEISERKIISTRKVSTDYYNPYNIIPSYEENSAINIDLLLVFGLRIDDSGLIQAATQQIRGCKIIAINTLEPEFYSLHTKENSILSSVGNYPYTWIHADLNDILPLLEKSLKSTEGIN